MLVEAADILGIDLPCNSWSCARRAPQHSRMPSAVRSNASLMGLPGLASTIRSLNKHNVMFRRSMNWAKKYKSQEGVVTSRIHSPAVCAKQGQLERWQKLRNSSCSDMTCASVGYSTNKSTRLRCWGWIEWASYETCEGRGVCARTSRQHVKFTGIVDGVVRLMPSPLCPQP